MKFCFEGFDVNVTNWSTFGKNPPSPEGSLLRTFVRFFYNYFVTENYLEKYYEEKVIIRIKCNNFVYKQFFVWLTFNFTFYLFQKMSLDDDRYFYCNSKRITGDRKQLNGI